LAKLPELLSANGEPLLAHPDEGVWAYVIRDYAEDSATKGRRSNDEGPGTFRYSGDLLVA